MIITESMINIVQCCILLTFNGTICIDCMTESDETIIISVFKQYTIIIFP